MIREALSSVRATLSPPAQSATRSRIVAVGHSCAAGPVVLSSTALSVAGLSLQGRRSGLFGRKMMVFGLLVAVVLLASLAFIPIVALLVWLVVTAVVLIRSPAIAVESSTATR